MKVEVDGVTVETKSILTALKIIKIVCEDNIKKCENCPLHVEGVCGVRDLEPCDWAISEYAKWQALM